MYKFLEALITEIGSFKVQIKSSLKFVKKNELKNLLSSNGKYAVFAKTQTESCRAGICVILF